MEVEHIKVPADISDNATDVGGGVDDVRGDDDTIDSGDDVRGCVSGVL